ncbi:MAG: UDP-N-acetylglucosamine 1-carboxyvinyltransferase [Lachnospiraceae bacterium]|nr:UDP-N-acetylglucosamine 1-carboxyvinyltransferase [Lachnospiraceae bacterium]
MSAISIEKSENLEGRIIVQGAKNEVLPVLCATVVNGNISIIHNCPRISDVYNTIRILNNIGCKTEWIDNNSLMVNSKNLNDYRITCNFARMMRSSIIFTGALVSRCKKAVCSYPGGCVIGERPIDIHIDAFRQMGIKVISSNKGIECIRYQEKDCRIKLRFPSVGATENIILASIIGNQTVYIYNYAKEPEIISLCSFLIKMGGIIDIRKEYIKITGVNKSCLKNVEYCIESDRIVAGTYMFAVAGCKGDVVLEGADINKLRASADILKSAGVLINSDTNRGIAFDKKYIRIKMKERFSVKGKVITGPYPYFSTDMQSPLMALMAGNNTEFICIENMFENRFKMSDELIKMGADIIVKENMAIIKGKQLHGCVVNATDLRSGAGLVIAGLGAEGRTVIQHADYIYRGYEDILRDINNIGGNIHII